jgi:hypothetical protein
MVEYRVAEQIKYEHPAHDSVDGTQALGRRDDMRVRQTYSELIMDSAEKKTEAGNKTSLGDLERVVKVRKYQHCEAQYLQLAKEPNTMPEVRDRYVRIAHYYRELAETEPATIRAPREKLEASAS